MRGSQITPDISLGDAVQNVREAEERLEKAHHQLELAKESIRDLEKASLQKLSDPTSEDLLSIIKTLNARIDNLEKVEQTAESWSLTQNETLIRTVKQLACGGIAGATARTVVAPIDRVKILMQTQFLNFKGAKDPKYTGISQTVKTIFKEEGFSRLWRGNMTNIVRVVPYSATQFASYDFYKRTLFGDDELATHQRLIAGALAGTTATSITHPLDLVRLRLNVDPKLTGFMDAARGCYSEAGAFGFFKGYVPTVLSLAPFIAINFSAFDKLKKVVYPNGETSNTVVVLGLGAAAGLFAQTLCYPLDTVRRRMQLKGKNYSNTVDAFRTIGRVEGFRGFYKGISANALKVIPNNAIRFLVYDTLKDYLGMADRKR